MRSKLVYLFVAVCLTVSLQAQEFRWKLGFDYFSITRNIKIIFHRFPDDERHLAESAGRSLLGFNAHHLRRREPSQDSRHAESGG